MDFDIDLSLVHDIAECCAFSAPLHPLALFLFPAFHFLLFLLLVVIAYNDDETMHLGRSGHGHECSFIHFSSTKRTADE